MIQSTTRSRGNRSKTLRKETDQKVTTKVKEEIPTTETRSRTSTTSTTKTKTMEDETNTGGG